MSKITNQIALGLWNRALTCEIGIRIQTTDKAHLTALLYNVRKASGDPRLQSLIILRPNNDEVWICKKEVEIDD